jgi:integrase
VRACFRQAVKWKKLRVSPCEVVAAWDLEEKRRRVLSPDELRIVLQGLPPKYALMCRVTLECLARLSEVLSLMRADIGPSWLLRRLKGGTRLRVGITPELAADLRRQCATLEQVHVFGDPPPRQEATSSYFTRLFRGLGLDGVSHHSMRHTGVTLMLDAGRNPQAIQRLAGWSSLRMLERYGHVNDAEMVQAVAGNAAYLRQVLA